MYWWVDRTFLTAYQAHGSKPLPCSLLSQSHLETISKPSACWFRKFQIWEWTNGFFQRSSSSYWMTIHKIFFINKKVPLLQHLHVAVNQELRSKWASEVLVWPIDSRIVKNLNRLNELLVLLYFRLHVQVNIVYRRLCIVQFTFFLVKIILSENFIDCFVNWDVRSQFRRFDVILINGLHSLIQMTNDFP